MQKDHVGYLLKLITDKIRVKADADLKRHNLTLTQSRVLACLNERGGQATQKELETFLNVSHPTVAGLVARMEGKGFLICWPDPRDKRNKMVQLTEKSRAMGREMDQIIAEQEHQMLGTLSEEQIAGLKAALLEIYKNLSG